jgi:methanogenic corrinoid protein MtbC1
MIEDRVVRGPVGPFAQAVTEEVCEALGLPKDDRLHETVAYLVGNLDAALGLDEPVLLTDQLRWQTARLALVAPAVDLDVLLSALRRALAPRVEDAVLRAMELQLHMAREMLLDHDDPTPETAPEVALDVEVQTYLDHVLAGRRDAAVRMVVDAVEAGRDVGSVLLELLQPAQLEIGRLWERGEITVAQEHLTTAVTQLAMAMLYPYLFEGPESDRRLVATGVGSEAHEIGIRMVADLAQRDGWATTYLGSGSPVGGVVDEVVRRAADVLAVSATMTSHVPHVRTLIAAVRSDPRCAGVRIVVGGRPFGLAPQLAAHVGADAWAPDGLSAVNVCNALVDTARASA